MANLSQRVMVAIHGYVLHCGYTYVGDGTYTKRGKPMLTTDKRNAMNKAFYAVYVRFMERYLNDGAQFIDDMIRYAVIRGTQI